MGKVEKPVAAPRKPKLLLLNNQVVREDDLAQQVMGVINNGVPRGAPGVQDSDPPFRDDRMVRVPAWILLGHELCGHALTGKGHPDEGAYNYDDPVIKIENEIRAEHTAGGKDGNLGVHGDDLPSLYDLIE